MHKPSKKLNLARETVRNLDVDALGRAGGGAYYAIYQPAYPKCTFRDSGGTTMQGGEYRPILPGGGN